MDRYREEANLHLHQQLQQQQEAMRKQEASHQEELNLTQNNHQEIKYELNNQNDKLTKKLDKDYISGNSPDYVFNERDFRLNMLEDQMASEKLSEGITGFSKAIEELENLLLNRYTEISNEKLIKM